MKNDFLLFAAIKNPYTAALKRAENKMKHFCHNNSKRQHNSIKHRWRSIKSIIAGTSKLFCGSVD